MTNNLEIKIGTERDVDIVGSVVLYKTDSKEIARAISQFRAIPCSTHLCIIDNSPTPAWEAKSNDADVSYLYTGANIGYGRAHNIAIRAAGEIGAKHCLVMNTDVWYEPDSVLRLKNCLNKRPNAGLAAPRICYPDGTLQYVCRLLPTPMNLFLRRFLPRSSVVKRSDWRYEIRWWDHASVANIPYFQGSFLMLKTELVNEIGGFDERFFLYGEDVDLCRRLHALSETLYVPDAYVKHAYRRYSARSLLGTWYGIQNNMRYFNKWGWFIDEDRSRINRDTEDRLRRSADKL